MGDSLARTVIKKRKSVSGGMFPLHLELIFSRELQLMSGSSELLASIGGIWTKRGKLWRSCFFCQSLRVHTGILAV